MSNDDHLRRLERNEERTLKAIQTMERVAVGVEKIAEDLKSVMEDQKDLADQVKAIQIENASDNTMKKIFEWILRAVVLALVAAQMSQFMGN